MSDPPGYLLTSEAWRTDRRDPKAGSPGHTFVSAGDDAHSHYQWQQNERQPGSSETQASGRSRQIDKIEHRQPHADCDDKEQACNRRDDRDQHAQGHQAPQCAPK